MKKFFVFCLLAVSAAFFTYGQSPEQIKPVKNVILMIPDGTSIGVISAARWYKMYSGLGGSLNIDPYISGTVSSFGSNSIIPDSAPTMACYMTGVPQQGGNISIYPVADPENDLVPINPAMAYNPLATLIEAARIVQGKSTGIIATCEFTHATPAACASHHYSRNNYTFIAPQMAYNNLDVLFGGGTSLVSDDMKVHFTRNGTTLIENDLTSFRNFSDDGKLWALFGRMAMPYDLDRDHAQMPSLEEMTRKAIERLSKNPNGFFLMVEGSQVDWAAHANDAVGCITEFIAFDNAVGAAMEFARTNGETVVIVVSDHGNSGFSIGRNGWRGGDNLSNVFDAMSKYQKAAPGMEAILNRTQPEDIKDVFLRYAEIEISDEELQSIVRSRNYNMRGSEPSNERTLSNNIVAIMNLRTPFGFTTGSHTGEELLLAAYHPDGHRPTGHITNIQLNEYMQKATGLTTTLSELSKKLFAKHTDVLAGLEYSIETRDEFPYLTVTKGNNTMTIRGFSSVANVNGNLIDLESVTVYIDRNETFYLPVDLLARTGF